jgi:hypothetical protein
MEKLRVIHIYEADWNLISKYFVSYKLHKRACKEETVRTEQTGGRPGKSASHAATLATITSEIILLQKLTGATLYNDAAACFDRIIENISNATLMREGLNPKIAELHAQTLMTAKYYIKTSKGNSKIPNGHNLPEPFYGTGQGAADSMPRWSLLSDLIIRIYKEKAKTGKIYSPLSKIEISALIQAYVDDTHSNMIAQSVDHLINILKHNAALWEKLLYTIGGKLEITKCKFVIYNWLNDKNGTLTLKNNKSIGSIFIEDSETKKQLEIKEIDTLTPYKLLGVHNAPSDNQLGNKIMLEGKANKMAKLIKLADLPTNEMETCMKTIVIPTLCYGQSAMHLEEKVLSTIQRPMTQLILPKLGYNRHTPRAVVYASKQVGGMELNNLYTEQGLAQIKYIIGGWRNNQEHKKIITTLIESYIVASGTIGNPLEHPKKREYLKSNWIDSVCTFLIQINAKITINDLTVFQLHRVKDEGIMEKAMSYTKDTNRLISINNCRIYLQAVTIAEISHISGTRLLKEAYHGLVDENDNPSIRKHSQSTVMWPIQPRPPEKSWRIWKKFLKKFLHHNCLHWKCPVARWLPNSKPNRVWIDQVSKKVITNITPIPRTQKKKKISAEEARKLIELTHINIMLKSKTTKQQTITSWTIYNGTDHVVTEKSSRNTSKYQNKELGDLLALQLSLEYIISCYKTNNAAIPENNITIWAPTQKIGTILKSLRYAEQTIYTLTGIEADQKNFIQSILKQFQNYKVKDPITNIKQWVAEHQQMQKKNEIGPREVISKEINQRIPPIQILINNEPVSGDLQKWIRHESTINEYNLYISCKMDWNEDTLQSIDWEALAQAIEKTNNTQKFFLTKYIHGWLPTSGHPGYTSPKGFTKTCPLCLQSDETNMHFRICKWERLQDTSELMENFNKKKTESEIEKTLYKAIASIANNEKIEINDKYIGIAIEQKKIGWDNIMTGRFSSKWSEEYDKETKTTNGKHWIASTITTIFKHQNKRWIIRCDKAAAGELTMKNENNLLTDNIIKEIYNQKENLDFIDKQLLKVPLATRLKLPLAIKINWVSRIKEQVKRSTKRSKEKMRKNTHTIRKYFEKVTKNSQVRTKQKKNPKNLQRKTKDKVPKKVRKENWKPP